MNDILTFDIIIINKMGNNLGQNPSQTFLLIYKEILDEKKSGLYEIKLDINKHDYHKILLSAGKWEYKYIDHLIDLTKYTYGKEFYMESLLKTETDRLISNDDFKISHTFLDITEDDIIKLKEVIGKNKVVDKKEFHEIISCDIILLDLAYGLYQVEMANNLISGFEYDNKQLDNLKNKNEKLVEHIKSTWNLTKDKNNNIATLIKKTINKVRPCDEAIRFWKLTNALP